MISFLMIIIFIFLTAASDVKNRTEVTKIELRRPRVNGTEGFRRAIKTFQDDGVHTARRNLASHSYRQHDGKDRHGGDISCGIYSSHSSIKHACTTNSNCVGYSFRYGNPWCLKTKDSSTIDYDSDHVYYEKNSQIKKSVCKDLQSGTNGRWVTYDSTAQIIGSSVEKGECIELCEARGVEGVCLFKKSYQECWFSAGGTIIDYRDRYSWADTSHIGGICKKDVSCTPDAKEIAQLWWDYADCNQMQKNWNVCTNELDAMHNDVMRKCPATCAMYRGECGDVPESRNCWTERHACVGSSLGDFHSPVETCIRKCEENSSCNCITWLKGRHQGHCRLESGSYHTHRNTNSYKAMTMEEAKQCF